MDYLEIITPEHEMLMFDLQQWRRGREDEIIELTYHPEAQMILVHTARPDLAVEDLITARILDPLEMDYEILTGE